MTRILLIVFGYGVFLLVFTYGIVWCVGRWERSEGQAEQERRRTLDRVMKASEKPYSGQRARQYNHPSAPGLDRDRNRVS